MSVVEYQILVVPLFTMFLCNTKTKLYYILLGFLSYGHKTGCGASAQLDLSEDRNLMKR